MLPLFKLILFKCIETSIKNLKVFKPLNQLSILELKIQ